jgi:hypothetical protein
MNEKCNTTIDYGFDDGLRLKRVSHIVPTAEGTENTLSNDGKIIQISPERMKELEINPWDDVNKDGIEKVIEQLRNPRYIRGLGGIGFEAAVFGDIDAEELQVVYYGWGGDFRHPNAQREERSKVYAKPNVAYMVMNGPGIGNSGMLPKSVQKEIRQTGSYVSAGEYYAKILEHVAQDYDKVNVAGHSLGARVATGVVANMTPEAVSELRLHDPTGTREMSLVDIAVSFFGKEGAENGKYVKESVSPTAKEAGLTPLAVEVPRLRDIEYAKGVQFSPEALDRPFEAPKNSWIQSLLVDPYGLKRNAFEKDFRMAAPNVRDSIHILVPELSHLNKWEDIQMIVERARNIPGIPEIDQWNILRHTHANMNQPASLAAIYSVDLG